MRNFPLRRFVVGALIPVVIFYMLQRLGQPLTGALLAGGWGLGVVLVVVVFVLLYYWDRTVVVSYRENWTVWFIPLAIYGYNCFVLIGRQLFQIFIPVAFFSAIHLGFIFFTYQYSRRKAMS